MRVLPRAGRAAIVASLVLVSIGSPPAAGADPVFTISGSGSGLHPGAAQTIAVTVDNTFDDPLHVASINAQVVASSSPCPMSALDLSAFAGDFVVAPHASATVDMVAELTPTATDVCMNTEFTLRFTGVGTAGTDTVTGTSPAGALPAGPLATTGGAIAPVAAIGAGALLLGLAFRRRRSWSPAT